MPSRAAALSLAPSRAAALSRARFAPPHLPLIAATARDGHERFSVVSVFLCLRVTPPAAVLVNLDSHDDLGCPPPKKGFSAEQLAPLLAAADPAALAAMDIGARPPAPPAPIRVPTRLGRALRASASRAAVAQHPAPA